MEQQDTFVVVGAPATGRGALARELAGPSATVVHAYRGIAHRTYGCLRAAVTGLRRGAPGEVGAALVEAIGGGPLVLADLDLADPATIDLVGVLAGDARLAVTVDPAGPAGRRALEVAVAAGAELETVVRPSVPPAPDLGPVAAPVRAAALRLVLLGRPFPAAMAPLADELVAGGLGVVEDGMLRVRGRAVRPILDAATPHDIQRAHAEVAAAIGAHDLTAAALHLLAAGDNEGAAQLAIDAFRADTDPTERALDLEVAALADGGDEIRLQAARELHRAGRAERVPDLVLDLADRPGAVGTEALLALLRAALVAGDRERARALVASIDARPRPLPEALERDLRDATERLGVDSGR